MSDALNSAEIYNTYRKCLADAATALTLLNAYCRDHELNRYTTLNEILGSLGETSFVDKWPEIKITLPFGMECSRRFSLSGHTFHLHENRDNLAPETILIYVAGPSGLFYPSVLAMPELIDKLSGLVKAISDRVACPERDDALAKSKRYWNDRIVGALTTLNECNLVDALDLTATERLNLQQILHKLNVNHK